MRTGAVTAIGARYLARPDSKVLGHIGARGTAYWNVRLIDRLFELDEIRVHSRRPESRNAFAERAARERARAGRRHGRLGVLRARRRHRRRGLAARAPEPLLRTGWIEPGALVVPYGTMSAVELSLLGIADKVVVDDWGQASTGRLGVAARARRRGSADARDAARGARRDRRRHAPGPRAPGETIVFWHRGLSLSDIALGHAMLEKAHRLGIGQTLRYR